MATPYGGADEATRVHRAVAIAQLVIDVLAETGDDDPNIADAEVRVGIDTGRALAVNNGRSGYREPLFLGRPANQWGGAVKEIQPGDVAWIPPGVKHWHGAGPTTGTSHVAVSESLDGKSVEWLAKVSDEQYGLR